MFLPSILPTKFCRCPFKSNQLEFRSLLYVCWFRFVAVSEREWDRRWYCTEATTSEEKNKRSYSTKVTIMFVVVTLIFIPCFVSCCLLAVCLTNSILSLVSFTLELLFLVCLFSFSPIFLQISDQSKSMRFNLIFILYFLLLLLLLCVSHQFHGLFI